MASCRYCLALVDGDAHTAKVVHEHLMAIGDHEHVHNLFFEVLHKGKRPRLTSSHSDDTLSGGGVLKKAKESLRYITTRSLKVLLRLLRLLASTGLALVSYGVLAVTNVLLQNAEVMVTHVFVNDAPREVKAQSIAARELFSNMQVVAGGVFTITAAHAAGKIAQTLVEAMGVRAETKESFSWQRIAIHIVRIVGGLTGVFLALNMDIVDASVAILMVIIFTISEIIQVMRKKLNELPKGLLAVAAAFMLLSYIEGSAKLRNVTDIMNEFVRVKKERAREKYGRAGDDERWKKENTQGEQLIRDPPDGCQAIMCAEGIGNRRHYRQWARHHHPDKHVRESGAENIARTARMMRVNACKDEGEYCWA